MKVVRIIGGLGNQMFQYAFYLSLRKRYKSVLLDATAYKYYKLHDYQIDKIFNLPELKYANIFVRIIFRMCNRLHIVKEDTLYHPDVFEVKGYKFFSGYWNSELYFKHIEKEVRSNFKFKNKLNGKNQDLASEITSCNSVSLHVRRGDYVNSNLNDSIYGNICTLSYYQKAISKIEQIVDSPQYFIFSNDIEWCKDNLKIQNAKFIYWNTGPENYIDMHLISLCKNNIIANSSFSWWGAWLNENPNKIVISPSKFFNEIIPSDINTLIPNSWIKISV